MRGEWFAADANVKQAVTSWLQTIESNFLKAGIKASVWHGGTDAGDYVELCCVPSATNVPFLDGSQNKVLGIRIFFTVWAWEFQLHCNNKDCNKWHSLSDIISVAKQITSFYKPSNIFRLEVKPSKGLQYKIYRGNKVMVRSLNNALRFKPYVILASRKVVSSKKGTDIYMMTN